MNIKQLIKRYSDKLDQLDVELLLSYTLGKPREFVVAHPEVGLGFWQGLKFKRYLNKRKRGVPIAYITGHKGFYGLDFLVNKHTLIPRPDSELMVEEVLERLKSQDSKIAMVDVGVGSGCIPVSILKTLNNKKIKSFATDISSGALKIAKKNTNRHGVEIEFLQGNLLEPILNKKTLEQFEHIFITANLPYLTEEQFTSEESIQHEPKSALVAGDGGLALYEELLKQLKLSRITYHVSLFFEIDPTQADKIKVLIKKYLPTAKVEIKKDLAGHNRVVIVECKSK